MTVYPEALKSQQPPEMATGLRWRFTQLQITLFCIWAGTTTSKRPTTPPPPPSRIGNVFDGSVHGTKNNVYGTRDKKRSV